MAQWIEHQPVNQKVAGLIPCQSTCLGCGPGPWLGAWERQTINVSPTLMFLSPSFSLPSPLSKRKKNIPGIILEKLETVTACEEEKLIFPVFPFVTFELCTIYVYYLLKSKVFLKQPLILKIYFMYPDIPHKRQAAVY